MGENGCQLPSAFAGGDQGHKFAIQSRLANQKSRRDRNPYPSVFQHVNRESYAASSQLRLESAIRSRRA